MNWLIVFICVCCHSVCMLSFSHSVWLFAAPWTAAPQVPCSSLSSGVCSDSRLSCRWCHPTISSSVAPFSSCPQSFPASGSFPVTQIFPSGGQSIRASYMYVCICAYIHSIYMGYIDMCVLCICVYIYIYVYVYNTHTHTHTWLYMARKQQEAKEINLSVYVPMDGRKTLNKYMKRVENVRLWQIIWNKVKGKGSARIREGAAFAILRRSSKSTPHTLWKDWYWSWSSSILVTWWEQPVHWESPWCWERLRVEEEEGIRGWDGWMASQTQWTWTWANSRRWWGTGSPGVLQSWGPQRVGHDWVAGQQQFKEGCTEKMNVSKEANYAIWEKSIEVEGGTLQRPEAEGGGGCLREQGGQYLWGGAW